MLRDVKCQHAKETDRRKQGREPREAARQICFEPALGGRGMGASLIAWTSRSGSDESRPRLAARTDGASDSGSIDVRAAAYTPRNHLVSRSS